MRRTAVAATVWGMTDETPDEMSAAEARHDQLTTAPEATEEDAAPRIRVTDRGDGVKRIDIRDDAPVRPSPAPAAESGGEPEAG